MVLKVSKGKIESLGGKLVSPPKGQPGGGKSNELLEGILVEIKRLAGKSLVVPAPKVNIKQPKIKLEPRVEVSVEQRRDKRKFHCEIVRDNYSGKASEIIITEM